jgi:hypothetical protein
MLSLAALFLKAGTGPWPALEKERYLDLEEA